MNKQVIWTTRFKKDYKLALKRHFDISLLDEIIHRLAFGETLPEKYKDHYLTGTWAGYRECHIQPDWLLIYRTDDEKLLLLLVRTGTHSDLFSE